VYRFAFGGQRGEYQRGEVTWATDALPQALDDVAFGEGHWLFVTGDGALSFADEFLAPVSRPEGVEPDPGSRWRAVFSGREYCVALRESVAVRGAGSTRLPGTRPLPAWWDDDTRGSARAILPDGTWCRVERHGLGTMQAPGDEPFDLRETGVWGGPVDVTTRANRCVFIAEDGARLETWWAADGSPAWEEAPAPRACPQDLFGVRTAIDAAFVRHFGGLPPRGQFVRDGAQVLSTTLYRTEVSLLRTTDGAAQFAGAVAHFIRVRSWGDGWLWLATRERDGAHYSFNEVSASATLDGERVPLPGGCSGAGWDHVFPDQHGDFIACQNMLLTVFMRRTAPGSARARILHREPVGWVGARLIMLTDGRTLEAFDPTTERLEALRIRTADGGELTGLGGVSVVEVGADDAALALTAGGRSYWAFAPLAGSELDAVDSGCGDGDWGFDFADRSRGAVRCADSEEARITLDGGRRWRSVPLPAAAPPAGLIFDEWAARERARTRHHWRESIVRAGEWGLVIEDRLRIDGW
jgi:hypothetical protein